MRSLIQAYLEKTEANRYNSHITNNYAENSAGPHSLTGRPCRGYGIAQRN